MAKRSGKTIVHYWGLFAYWPGAKIYPRGILREVLSITRGFDHCLYDHGYGRQYARLSPCTSSRQKNVQD